jgi:hypothetical protein
MRIHGRLEIAAIPNLQVLTLLILLVLFGRTGTAAQVGGGELDEDKQVAQKAPSQVLAAAGEAFPITISLDPHLSIETGSDLTFAVSTLLAELEGRAFSRLKLSRRVGIPLRIARIVFIDHPIALFLVVMQHEAFGHGGRAREFGSSAGYSMGSPWTIDALFKGSTRFGAGASYDPHGLSLEEKMFVSIGGVEANARSATLIERELVAGSTMRPLQFLYTVRSRSYASSYVLLNTPTPISQPARFYSEWNGGGDVADYLGYLNTKYHGGTGITPQGSSATVIAEYRRLRSQAWLNLFDPGAWLSLWSVARQVGGGEEPSILSVPSLAGRRFLPILTSDWTPDGGMISVETVFQVCGPRWFSFVLRQGNGPGGRLWSVGAATEMFAEWRFIRMGGEVEVWNQPSHGTGAGANLRLVVTRGRTKGLLFDAGLKSSGHWPGRAAEPGAFFRIGYRFTAAH